MRDVPPERSSPQSASAPRRTPPAASPRAWSWRRPPGGACAADRRGARPPARAARPPPRAARARPPARRVQRPCPPTPTPTPTQGAVADGGDRACSCRRPPRSAAHASGGSEWVEQRCPREPGGSLLHPAAARWHGADQTGTARRAGRPRRADLGLRLPGHACQPLGGAACARAACRGARAGAEECAAPVDCASGGPSAGRAALRPGVAAPPGAWSCSVARGG